ncbi:hypothetical protein SCANM63S_02917 [Streptomyces canarius]
MEGETARTSDLGFDALPEPLYHDYALVGWRPAR